MWIVEEEAIVKLLLPDGVLMGRGKDGRSKLLLPGKEALNTRFVHRGGDLRWSRNQDLG